MKICPAKIMKIFSGWEQSGCVVFGQPCLHRTSHKSRVVTNSWMCTDRRKGIERQILTVSTCLYFLKSMSSRYFLNCFYRNEQIEFKVIIVTNIIHGIKRQWKVSHFQKLQLLHCLHVINIQANYLLHYYPFTIPLSLPSITIQTA